MIILKSFNGGFSFDRGNGSFFQIVGASMGVRANMTTGQISITTGPNLFAPVGDSYGQQTVTNNGNTSQFFNLSEDITIDGVVINGDAHDKMNALQATIFKGQTFITE